MDDFEQENFKQHSEQAEHYVIGALLTDCNGIDKMSKLEFKHFYVEAHQIIFRAIVKLAATDGKWDIFTVSEFLERHKLLDRVGGFAYLGGLASATPTAANIQHYANIVVEYASRRALKAVAADLIEMLKSPDDIPKILDRAQSMLLSIGSSASADDPRTISNIMAEHMDTISRRVDREQSGIKTGLVDLDRLLNGGLRGGQVVVLAGRPSMGKTGLSMSMAMAVAEAGNPVLYLSMEMVAAELADRVIASLGRVPLGKITEGDLDDKGWDGIGIASNRINKMPLYVLDKAGLSYFRLATVARRFARQHGIKMLVVDYLQLMSGDDNAKRHAQIEEISRNMKVLAKELNIPILLLSQLNRQAERRPKLSHLRDSGAIEQDADIVLFVHREEVDDPETPYKNYADIYVAKNRQGKLGRIGAVYQGEFCRFDNYYGNLPSYDEVSTTAKKGKQYD